MITTKCRNLNKKREIEIVTQKYRVMIIRCKSSHQDLQIVRIKTVGKIYSSIFFQLNHVLIFKKLLTSDLLHKIAKIYS